MPLTRITHHSSPEIRARLDDLLLDTFDFSLADWHARGLWTADYTCYALVEEGQVRTSAGVYRMDMLVRGQKQVWMQLGAVATHPDRRGQGLSRQLLQAVFAQYPHTPFFLFANDSVVDFYPRFGFQPVADRQPRLELHLPLNSRQPGSPPGAAHNMRKLSVDDPAVRQYLEGRACFSGLLDCTNAAPLNEFHLRLAYAGCIYEIPALRTLVVARQQGDTLSILDVVAGQAVTFAGLLPYLGFSGVREIRFGFNPDWLAVETEMVPTEAQDATPIFARGGSPGQLPLPASGEWMLPLLLRS